MNNMMKYRFTIIIFLLFFVCADCMAEYYPKGNKIVCINGKNRFTRAIYGTNTPFRFETSDFPEVGLYMPNMGGSIYFALKKGERIKWIDRADNIESIYAAGCRSYTVKDKEVLGEGELRFEMLAWADADGVIVKIEPVNLPSDFRLLTCIGGATDEHFRREGDMGADKPDCFYIKAEDCNNNSFKMVKNTFFLSYGKKRTKQLYGIFPETTQFKLVDAGLLDNISLLEKSEADEYPLLMAESELKQVNYLGVVNPLTTPFEAARNLVAHYEMAVKYRDSVADKIVLDIPDEYLNPMGRNLAIAADAVWQSPTFLHGAIGWRIPLLGWRHCYIGDFLGWKERARSHFDYYAKLQLTQMPDKPVTMDEAQRLARPAYILGTPMYSSGYIANCQDNALYYYDMNLVYIDTLLWHINWTGDLDYARKMWPVIKRHLDWEKRTFDADNDGLYDALCCIWASDALQYSGGAVTHSTAYNYRANKLAAIIAEKIGEDGSEYRKEAALIKTAIDNHLWIKDKGWWAEYKGTVKNTELHESAAAWTIYHAIDSELSKDNLQGYQAARYAVKNLPHIPVINPSTGKYEYSVVSTTNWMPYEWSVNNVALAESAHTALALFQAGMNEEAYRLMKGAVIDVMYKGKSPGNFGMTTSYDIVGEVYRDFSDAIGIFGRLLVQGLFGITPNALDDRLFIVPGFPAEWKNASLETSDIAFSFKREGKTDRYTLKQKGEKKLQPVLRLSALYDKVHSVRINGRKSKGKFVSYVGKPIYEISCKDETINEIEILWEGRPITCPEHESWVAHGDKISVKVGVGQELLSVVDPQTVLRDMKIGKNSLEGTVIGEIGHRTFFAKVRQGDAIWMMPIHIEVRNTFEVVALAENPDNIIFKFKNNAVVNRKFNYSVNGTYCGKLSMDAKSTSENICISKPVAIMGSNKVTADFEDGARFEGKVMNWELKNDKSLVYAPVDISMRYNDRVSRIFKNKYLSPRWQFTTLQQPVHGFGDWCVPLRDPRIEDVSFAGMIEEGIFNTSLGIPFNTNEGIEKNNILFTSLWDNFPDSISIPLDGKASHVYFLMAGSTNHMQSRFRNGTVKVYYKDGTYDWLDLINPDTWVPIEQDFYIDEYAYKITVPRPYRVMFKNGVCSRDLTKDLGLKMKAKRMIDGGAAVLLDLPLDNKKDLDKLILKTEAYEVIIGIMGITLVK